MTSRAGWAFGIAGLIAIASCTGDDPESSASSSSSGGASSGGSSGSSGGDGSTRVCAATDRTCVGAEMRACADDGSGFSATALEVCVSEGLCKSGLAGGKCSTPACADGELKCEGADRFACLADRTAFSSTKLDTCAEPTPACVAGKCVTCATGTTRCAGKTPEKCDAEAWQPQAACTGLISNTCIGGACMDARFARWPMPNEPSAAIRPAKFTVISANIVRDDVTGLEWQKGVSTSDVNVAAGAYRAHCEQLSVDGTGGWHTPTPVEILSLVDYGRGAAPFIDTTKFTDTPANGLVGSWSGANWPRVDTSTGLMPLESITGFAYRVRCVRSPKTLPTGTRFTVVNGEVFDDYTKLVWKQSGTNNISQANAATACTALGGGFRLPTLKELYTIVDPTAASAPYIDQTTFPSTATTLYWSITTDPLGTGALSVDFGTVYGAIFIQPKTGQNFSARCVK